MIDLRLPAALCLLCLAALCLLRFADARIHSWQIGAAFPAAPIMSHTARQALTIFQQWLKAEFKDTHLEFKRTFRTSDCVASNWLERLDWQLSSFNRVQSILGQEPLDSMQWYKQTGCCISSPGS